MCGICPVVVFPAVPPPPPHSPQHNFISVLVSNCSTLNSKVKEIAKKFPCGADYIPYYLTQGERQTCAKCSTPSSCSNMNSHTAEQFFCGEKMNLKGPSGQIRSPWKYCNTTGEALISTWCGICFKIFILSLKLFKTKFENLESLNWNLSYHQYTIRTVLESPAGFMLADL